MDSKHVSASLQLREYNVCVIDRYRNYQPRYQKPRPRRHKHRGLILLGTAALIVFTGKTLLSQAKPDKKPSTPASSTQKPKIVIKADPIATTTWNDLAQQIDTIIAQHAELDISIALIDIGTNTKAGYGFQDNFAGASTTKVLTAAAYLNQVEDGARSLDQTIDSRSAQQQLKQMINQSNNDAWAALNTNLTYKTIEAYARSIGITSYQSKNNLITASDEALLLQKLYKRELLNEEHTALLLSYMQNTNNEAMIPKVIPEGAVIYHKYGQLEDRLHDAAIINYKDRPIVVVIYTKGGAADGSNYQPRVQLIQQLAQTIFNTVYNER